jgi:hypothetical protein
MHPGLTAGLSAHPGVGVVAAQTEAGDFVAIGADGRHDLGSGLVDGRDPLEAYGPLAATTMANITASPDAGDLVVMSAYDPLTEEADSFEPQLGSHGGIGGPQTEPFLLYPGELEPAEEPLSLIGLDELRATFDRWLASVRGSTPASTSDPDHLGNEVCVTSEVAGASGRVCARRDGFGAAWEVELEDTHHDDGSVEATISLDVAEAPDETAMVSNDEDGSTVLASGHFRPRVGTGLGDIEIETCVAVRFAPHRCRTESAALPQLSPSATPAQRARLESLVFELPLEAFTEEWAKGERAGVDNEFDWSSNGCSAGSFRELFDDRLQPASVRHDSAYRNFGHLGLETTDEVRRRVDEQLTTDISALGQEGLASGFGETLQRFGGPAFHDGDLAALWGVPDFIVTRLGSDDLSASGAWRGSSLAW